MTRLRCLRHRSWRRYEFMPQGVHCRTCDGWRAFPWPPVWWQQRKRRRR